MHKCVYVAEKEFELQRGKSTDCWCLTCGLTKWIMLRVTEVTSHDSRVHSAVRPSEPHREKGGRVENELEVKRSMNQREKKHENRRERQRNRKCSKGRGERGKLKLMRTEGKILLLLF